MLRSMDPCVRAEALRGMLPRLSLPLRVSKPDVRELEIRTERVDATVVSLASCKEAARAYVACRLLRRVGIFGKLLQVHSIGMGMALSAVYALFFGVPSGFILTLWMLLWCACYATLSYFFLRRPVDEV